MVELAVGIDIGGTNTLIGLVNRKGETLTETNISTTTHSNIEDYFAQIAQEIQNLLTKLGEGYRLLGIGIGAPNGNYYNGTIEYAPNLNWRGVINVVELMQKHFSLPVVLTNDANAAALGEMIYGGAKEMKNFVVITLGTGLGSGLVVNGDVVYGHDGFAGELGHTVVKENGRLCGCGLRGCMETYVSATGLKRTYMEMMAYFPFKAALSSKSFDEITAKDISIAAQNGDKVALETFDYTARMLGQKIAETAAYLSPEAVFLFGGLAQSGELLFAPTRKYMEENMLSVYKNKIKLLPSQVDGANAAVLGASALIWKELESPRKK
jgi:glucokinase